MSSKIKVDTIENVAGSGNVSLGSGHNLVVPGNNTTSGNATVGGTLGVTGASTLGGDLQVGGSPPVSSAGIMSVINAGNSLEWGHGNAAGYRSTLGALSGGGQPFIALSAEHGTNANTFRTRGLKGHVIQTDNTGGLQFKALQTATGDNQTGTTTLSVDNLGRALKPAQPAFLAKGANANYITTSPVPFPTVEYNIGSHYNNSNYTFTAPIAGRYFFHAHMGLFNGSSGAQGYPWFSINGTQQQYSYINIAATWYSNGHLTGVFNLSANDTVKITVSLSSATYYNGPNETRFMGYLLG